MLHASTEPDSACINPGTTESHQAFRLGEWERHIDLQVSGSEIELLHLGCSVSKPRFTLEASVFDRVWNHGSVS